MAEESLPPTPVTKDSEERRQHALPLIIKIAEVLLAVLIIGLIVDPFNNQLRILNQPRKNLNDVATVYTTVCGYLVINMIFIIAYFLGDRIPKRTLIIFSVVGSCLHIAAASLMVHKWRKMTGSYIEYLNNAVYSSKQYNDMLISGAVFTFINALVFAVDVLITIKFT